ncbi:MAG: hypothetical protein CO093_09560 [Alphaproteobacteria bacterium CG_4_9_14_3_um_filter_47_13]|nr:MAG: hypothetical protein CO093_09560 [Alphaproteobacteria bacterium CG_4_9_14_3_um_filter_47_13]
MAFTVIDNPDFRKFNARSGFKNHHFKMLAGLFSRASSLKTLYDMAVDVDFDEGTCSVTYYQSGNYTPYLQFIVRHIGPHTDMYELYKEGKGRIAKSGLFQRIYERLEKEISILSE